MEAKIKAKELIDRYIHEFKKSDTCFGYCKTSIICQISEYKCEEWFSYAKKCGLIAVNEIINSNPHSNPINTEQYSTMEWWIEVRNEIEKL